MRVWESVGQIGRPRAARRELPSSVSWPPLEFGAWPVPGVRSYRKRQIARKPKYVIKPILPGSEYGAKAR